MSFRNSVFNIGIKNFIMEKKREDIKGNNNMAAGNKSEKKYLQIPNKEAIEPAEQARQPKIKPVTEHDNGIKIIPKANVMLRNMGKKRQPIENNGPKCDSVKKNKDGQLSQNVGEDNMTPSRNEDHAFTLMTCSQNPIMKTSQKSKFLSIHSQPERNLSHKEYLIWLQERRETGIWVQCNRLNCLKWRYLANVNDPTDMPEKWYCEMNPEEDMSSCHAKEEQLNIAEEEDLIHNKYTAGSVIWAKLAGYPWWPAMVDDCVDTEQYYWLDGFSDIPTHYNVVFFDSEEVTRAWIETKMIKPFKQFSKTPKSTERGGNRRYQSRINTAKIQADEALKLPSKKRLQKYSFISCYKGLINTPTKERTNKKPKNKKMIKIPKDLKKRIDIKWSQHQSKSNPRKKQSPVKSCVLEINHAQFMTEDETMGAKPRKELERTISSPDISTVAINGDNDFESNMEDTGDTSANHFLFPQEFLSHLEDKTIGIINDSSILPLSETEVCDTNFVTSPVLSQRSGEFK